MFFAIQAEETCDDCRTLAASRKRRDSSVARTVSPYFSHVESTVLASQLQNWLNGVEQRCFAARFQNEMRAEDEHARFAQHVGVRRCRLSILKNLAVDQVQDLFDDIPAEEKRSIV